MYLLPPEDSLAGYTRAVVEAEEANRRYMDQLDLEHRQIIEAQRKEHEMKMKTDPEYRKQHEELDYQRRIWAEAEAFERARLAEEEAYRKAKELEKLNEQKYRRRRFDDCARCLADDYEKGLRSGGVKEACLICEEYFRHGETADVTKEEFEEAFKKVLAYAYQKSSDTTIVSGYCCDDDCGYRDTYSYCKGSLLLKSDTGKKCPYFRKETK